MTTETPIVIASIGAAAHEGAHAADPVSERDTSTTTPSALTHLQVTSTDKARIIPRTCSRASPRTRRAHDGKILHSLLELQSIAARDPLSNRSMVSHKNSRSQPSNMSSSVKVPTPQQPTSSSPGNLKIALFGLPQCKSEFRQPSKARGLHHSNLANSARCCTCVHASSLLEQKHAQAMCSAQGRNSICSDS
jgi:hypothetical protein